MKNEHNGGVSSVLHYIPVRLNGYVIKQLLLAKENIQLFGFFKGEYYFTSSREVLNWGWSMQQMLEVVDFTEYKVFKCESPYMVYQQIRTHTQLDFLSHSQRYADCDRGYWMPPEVNTISQEDWNDGVSRKWRPLELRDLMTRCGVKRKEVFDRGKDMLQNRVFVIGGYTNNPNAWEHFITQRTDSHTQLETREFVEELSLSFNSI